MGVSLPDYFLNSLSRDSKSGFLWDNLRLWEGRYQLAKLPQTVLAALCKPPCSLRRIPNISWDGCQQQSWLSDSTAIRFPSFICSYRAYTYVCFLLAATPESPPALVELGQLPQLDWGWQCCQERQQHVGARLGSPGTGNPENSWGLALGFDPSSLLFLQEQSHLGGDILADRNRSDSHLRPWTCYSPELHSTQVSSGATELPLPSSWAPNRSSTTAGQIFLKIHYFQHYFLTKKHIIAIIILLDVTLRIQKPTCAQPTFKYFFQHLQWFDEHR